MSEHVDGLRPVMRAVPEKLEHRISDGEPTLHVRPGFDRDDPLQIDGAGHVQESIPLGDRPFPAVERRFREPVSAAELPDA